VYVVYLPHGRGISVKLEPGRYGVKWFNPRNGEYSTAGIAEGATWTSPAAPDNEDWVLLLTMTQAERERKLSASSINIAVNAVRFLYGVTLGHTIVDLMASVPI
jgi:hypothetical protein